MIEDYDFFEKGEFTYDVVYMEKNLHLIEDEKIEKFHINLKYLDKLSYNQIVKEKDKLKRMLYFLICDDDKTLNDVYRGDKFMKDVIEEAKDISKDDRIKLWFPLTDEEVLERDKAYIKKKAREEGLAEGRAEGFAKGIAEGRQESLIEIITKMNNDNLPLETIAKYVNLSIDQIKDILKKIKE